MPNWQFVYVIDSAIVKARQTPRAGMLTAKQCTLMHVSCVICLRDMDYFPNGSVGELRGIGTSMPTGTTISRKRRKCFGLLVPSYWHGSVIFDRHPSPHGCPLSSPAGGLFGLPATRDEFGALLSFFRILPRNTTPNEINARFRARRLWQARQQSNLAAGATDSPPVSDRTSTPGEEKARTGSAG